MTVSHCIVEDRAPTWSPYIAPELLVCSDAPMWIYVFTDGSTDPHAAEHSGYAVVFTNMIGKVLRRHCESVTTSGNTFNAEATPIMSALCLAPCNSNLRIHIESESVIGAVNNGRHRNLTTSD